MDYSLPQNWLPLFFYVAMGLSLLLYIVLDGYDLGVGILLPFASNDDKDMMVASIGPFWDANETWLVLSVGLLLVAFPYAHGIVLTELYLPAALMLMGLILRGVSFDFRAKAPLSQKPFWNFNFFFGSLLASITQGLMIGRVITGFDRTEASWIFAGMVAAFLPVGYALLGSTWLIMKTHGPLQMRAVAWARPALWLSAAGIAIVSVATPLLIPRIFDRWFSIPSIYWLAPVPVLTVGLLLLHHRALQEFTPDKDHRSWIPFAATVGIFWLALTGMAYSLFPYLIMNQMTLWQAASATESLWMIFWGAAVLLPTILIYTAYSYSIFRGKASVLHYD